MDRANQNFIAMLYGYATNSEWFKNKVTVKYQREGEGVLTESGFIYVNYTNS